MNKSHVEYLIENSNSKIYCKKIGEGEPIIFLHAGVADSRMWQAQMDELSKEYLVIAYDRRGFGKTETIDEPFSHVEDLYNLLSYFDIKKVNLVGCSQGGKISLEFSLKYPDKVNALFFIAPSISGYPYPEEYDDPIDKLEAELYVADEADDMDLVNEIEAHMWLDGPLSKRGRVQGETRSLFLDMNNIALKHVPLTKEINNPPAYPQLTNIKAPTFVCWGNLDYPDIVESSKHLVAELPNGDGIEIPNSAHLPNMEFPQIISNKINSFLKKLG